jgi:hypothetical protein
MNKAIDQKYNEMIAPYDVIKSSLKTKQISYQRKLEEERIRLEKEEQEKFEAKQKAIADAQIADE